MNKYTTNSPHTEPYKPTIIDMIGNNNKAKQPSGNIQYPVEVFPPEVTNLVNEASTALNFEPAYMLTTLLIIVGTTAGNKFKVKVKKEWYEGLNLYALLVGNSAAAKSPVMRLMFKPLQEYEKKRRYEYKQAVKSYEERKAAANAEKNEDFIEEEPKYIDRYILNNTTPEAMYNLICENEGRGLCVWADEALSFFKNMNKHNKGDDTGNFLTLNMNQPLKFDTKSGGAKVANNPCLSFIGSIQPDKLYNIVGKEEDGLSFRFLYAKSTKLLQPFNDEEVQDTTVAAYANLINKILEIGYSYDEYNEADPRIISMSVEARRIYKIWNVDITHRINGEGSDTGKSLYRKMQGYCCRIAGIMQVLNYVSNREGITDITANSMSAAIKLTEYYINTSFEAHGDNTYTNPANKLLGVKAIWYKELPEQFTTAEAVEIAARYDIAPSTCKKYLKDKGLFTKIKHGEYEKL